MSRPKKHQIEIDLPELEQDEPVKVQKVEKVRKPAKPLHN